MTITPAADDPAVVVVEPSARIAVSVTTLPAVALSIVPQASQEIEITPQPVVTVNLSPAGARGPSGADGNRFTVIAGANFQPLQAAVVLSDASVIPASSLTLDDGERVVGLATHSAIAGESLILIASGVIDNPAGMFPVGVLYLGEDGIITPSPLTGMVELSVGYAHTPTQIRVRIGLPIYHF